MKSIPYLQEIEHFKTPFLVYDTDVVRQQYNLLETQLRKLVPNTIIAYAHKTNPAVSPIVGELGGSFFVTSFSHFEEVKKYLREDTLVIFNHPAYSEEELVKLLPNKDVLTVIESEKQLVLANKVSQQLNKTTDIFIRVDTNVLSESTPFKPKYNLGIPLNKAISVIEYAQTLSSLNIVGIHSHFASQNNDLSSWKGNIERLTDLLINFSDIRTLNIGGGWPIEYTKQVSSPEEILREIFPSIKKLQKDRELKLIVEPGRFIAGPSGKLFTRVLDIRERDVPEVIVDASLLRTFGDRLFYGLQLETTAHNLSSKKSQKKYRIIGNSSVSIDDFGELLLDEVNIGDLLVFHQAGAYFSSINTDFTGLPKANEYLLENHKFKKIKNV